MIASPGWLSHTTLHTPVSGIFPRSFCCSLSAFFFLIFTLTSHLFLLITSYLVFVFAGLEAPVCPVARACLSFFGRARVRSLVRALAQGGLAVPQQHRMVCEFFQRGCRPCCAAAATLGQARFRIKKKGKYAKKGGGRNSLQIVTFSLCVCVCVCVRRRVCVGKGGFLIIAATGCLAVAARKYWS